MKGQILFVRRVEPSDWVFLRALYSSSAIPITARVDRGFIGKLVGDTVAHVATRLEDESEVVEFVLVDPRLRKKRVGSAIFREMEAILRSEGLRRILVASDCEAEGFFTRIGFKWRGGRIEKDVD